MLISNPIERWRHHNEALHVLDSVLALKFSNITISASAELVFVEPTYKHERRNDREEDSRSHFNDKVVEGDPF